MRALALVLALVALLPQASPAGAAEFTDATGRSVAIPDDPARVFAAGPPANVMLYVLKPEAMIGWVRAPRESALPYLLPQTRDLPELGWLSGGGDSLNLEVLLAAEPDLVFDLGTINETYRSLAERVQEQTGIPYILVDGSFENTPASIRELGAALGVAERAEALAGYADDTFALVDATLAKVPADARPRVYLARGPEGLESAVRGSINAAIIERAGGVNVVESSAGGGNLVTVSPEQIAAWAPDVIVTLDRGFAESVADSPAWAGVPAVAEGRVLLAPSAPFGFVDSPPAVNRLIGLRWLMHELYPDQAEGDLREEVREFYRLFYQVELDDAALERLLGG
jgi:iron complex transport system substrate-binding protein